MSGRKYILFRKEQGAAHNSFADEVITLYPTLWFGGTKWRFWRHSGDTYPCKCIYYINGRSHTVSAMEMVQLISEIVSNSQGVGPMLGQRKENGSYDVTTLVPLDFGPLR